MARWWGLALIANIPMRLNAYGGGQHSVFMSVVCVYRTRHTGFIQNTKQLMSTKDEIYVMNH